ncbi:MAG: epoxyqueuosine reductase, partial [Oscillospiraceae bacterium]|nr:epoxyqueuosine reductase [Oscillospiraceae bacterium]
MTNEKLLQVLSEFVENDPGNYVQEEDAIEPSLVGLKMYDAPLIAVADAADPLFEKLREPEVIHPLYTLPDFWTPGAKRVVSYFLPFSERVKKSNAVDPVMASKEWLHARIEGQEFMAKCGEMLRDLLIAEGYDASFPTTDPRFRLIHQYASNWSERHTAFICGLGTFGMSKGIITEKGMAGRFGSIITTCEELEVTPRKYTELY